LWHRGAKSNENSLWQKNGGAASHALASVNIAMFSANVTQFFADLAATKTRNPVAWDNFGMEGGRRRDENNNNV
jgi:hypothetical protein